MYEFINDRTLHLLNQGLRPMEIAEAIKELPGDLARKWTTRGHYGALSFNVRAVYQRFMGFYDGNPANLNPLPPVEAGWRYVAAMGGAVKVLAAMRAAMDDGEYRWAAQLGNHLVFAEPNNKAAREAQADALEQLGYQSENALWRNMYLMGAHELRHGVMENRLSLVAPDLLRALDPDQYFDLLAVRLDSPRAVGHDMTLDWVFPDLNRRFALTLRNGVLTHREGRHAKADATVTMTKAVLDRINRRDLDLPSATATGAITLEGDGKKLGELMGLMSAFNRTFPIVTP